MTNSNLVDPMPWQLEAVFINPVAVFRRGVGGLKAYSTCIAMLSRQQFMTLGREMLLPGQVAIREDSKEEEITEEEDAINEKDGISEEGKSQE
ncbi:hypothetical protein AVEN_179640-1 [Araneus ventricosus]|uniref:Uncharacterized protein n=1 Tax=Araneus ventricosus TaxID=182803 RepID=A0A4Y2BFG4_ARAVE|nr:hypothetical protein AVEN_179640-1 [Araneus ventricosus]